MSNTRETNPMLDLFCNDARNKLSELSQSLSQLRTEPTNKNEMKRSDNALTSVKGAAKIASLNQVFELTKAMGNILTAAEKKQDSVR